MDLSKCHSKFIFYVLTLGLCAPKPFGINPFYPVGYVALTLLIPLCVVTGVNVKITSIAQHHRVKKIQLLLIVFLLK